MGSGVRVHLPIQAIQGARAFLTNPQVVHYLLQVRRLGVGDALVGFDGLGTIYDGRIETISPTQVTIRLIGQRHDDVGGLRLTLAQALIKGSRFDWAVQKATELGVTTIVPLVTQHTVVRPTGRHDQKRLRWQRIATAAAQQCGRTHLPDVTAPLAFETFVSTLAPSQLALIPTLAVSTRPLRRVLQERAGVRDVVMLIGPEGDFSAEEVRVAQRYGAHPVSLGPLTLRAETAALAMLAILQYAVEPVHA